MAFKAAHKVALVLFYAAVEITIRAEDVLAVINMPPSLVTPPHLTFFLRKSTVFSFVPAFILCIPHGITSELAVPALGLIPMFFSSLLGAFLMYRDQISFGGSPITLTRANVLLADLAIGAFLLLILILSWIFIPKYWHGPEVMLGTYATVPLMLNFAIHVWFFVSNGVCFLAFHEGCANCRTSLHSQGESAPSLGDIGSSVHDDVEAATDRSEDYVRFP